MAKKDDKMQKSLNETKQEVSDLRTEVRVRYLSYMLWATGGLAGGFFVILLAIAINYFFNAPPGP